jgi:hypothetical protein
MWDLRFSWKWPLSCLLGCGAVWSYREGWYIYTAQSCYSRGALFESRPGQRLAWWCSLFSSVPLVKCRDRILIRPWTPPSKSFPIYYHQSSYYPMVYILVTEASLNKQCNLQCGRWRQNVPPKRFDGISDSHSGHYEEFHLLGHNTV